MSDITKLPLLTFPGEPDCHRELFEETPLCIVSMFLDCFDAQGRHVFQVPEHVLEALAGRFQLLMTRQCNFPR